MPARSTTPTPANLPIGRTMRAAHVRPKEHGHGPGVVKAGELVKASFVDGTSPSAGARKLFALLLAKAAGDAWCDQWHACPKVELRGSHQSTDRLQEYFDELLRTLLRVQVPSETGGPDEIQTGAVVSDVKLSTGPDARGAARWRFSGAMREVARRSDHYAELRTQVIAALESRYAVTLYEIGSLLYRARHPVWRPTVEEFKERLGVPNTYRDWTDIRRRSLEPAREELDLLAPFTMTWNETRRGRAVVSLEVWFTPKAPAELAEAAAEVQASRVGRKARRTGSVDVLSTGQRRLILDDAASQSDGET